MKNQRRNRLIALILSALAATAGLFGRWAEIAPEVEFITVKGESIRLSDLRGRPVLVTFWASDCRSCIEEIPDLAALYRDYSAWGFETIAVAMAYDPPNRVLETAKARQIPYKVALDPSGRLAEAFGRVQQVPNTLLIAQDGRIILRKLGRIRIEELRTAIERLLGRI